MNDKHREETLTLELLEAIEERSDVTQRHLAQRLNVALGLANSYLKRCVRKGLVKIQQAPANRYLYYLTPQGFAEKARLTGRYLSYSFELYRRAGASYSRALAPVHDQRWRRLVLCGASELAEIAALRALEEGLEVVGTFDPRTTREQLLGRPVHASLERFDPVDAYVLTSLDDAESMLSELRARIPLERLVVPDILGLRVEARAV